MFTPMFNVASNPSAVSTVRDGMVFDIRDSGHFPANTRKWDHAAATKVVD